MTGTGDADLRRRTAALARARRRADDERRRYRALFEEAPAAYVVTDRRAVIRQVNRMAVDLLDQPRTAVVGESLAAFVAPDARDAFMRLLATLAAGGPLHDIETTLGRAGRLVPVAVDATPALTGGAVREVRWLLRDTTRHARAQQALREAFESTSSDRDRLQDLDAWKNAFIAAAGHDLRGPLTSISARASALIDVAGDHDVLVKGLMRMVDEAEDLQCLLADLLDLDRFTRGAVRLRDRRVDLAAIVRGQVERSAVTTHEVALDLRPVIVRAEPRRIAQIVANLLRNAVQHTPEGTPVWVRTGKVPDGAIIVVEDGGPGLPSAPDRHEIFAPFVRVHRHGPTGAGIGLSLVSLFAQLHRGHAWAEPRPGGGARFSVFLPYDPRDRGVPSAVDDADAGR